MQMAVRSRFAFIAKGATRVADGFSDFLHVESTLKSN